MGTIDQIKSKIKKLYETNPNIHVNAKVSRPKGETGPVSAAITSVYPNFFCIEESSCGYAKKHTIRYAEVLTGQVHVLELGQFEEQ